MDLNSSINSYGNSQTSTPYAAKTDIIGSTSSTPSLEKLPKDVLELLKHGEYDNVMLKIKEIDKGNEKDLGKLLKLFMEGFKFIIPKNIFSTDQTDVKNNGKPTPVETSKKQDKTERNKVAKEVVKTEAATPQMKDSKAIDSAKLLLKTMESYLQSLATLASSTLQKIQDGANSLLQLLAKATSTTLNATWNPLIHMISPHAHAVINKTKEFAEDLKQKALEMIERAASAVAEQAKKLNEMAAPLRDWVVPTIDKFRELAEHSFKAAAETIKHVSQLAVERMIPIFAPIVNIVSGIPNLMNQTGQWMSRFAGKRSFGDGMGRTFRKFTGWLGEKSEGYFRKVEGVVLGILFSFSVVANWVYEKLILKIFKFLYEIVMLIVKFCQWFGIKAWNGVTIIGLKAAGIMRSCFEILKAIPLFCYEVLLHAYRQASAIFVWATTTKKTK